MTGRFLLSLAIAASLGSGGILLWFLIARPPLVRSTRVWLLMGLGAFPIAAALGGNAVGLEASKQVEFCGSCHVMEAWVTDALDPESTSLAAMHSHNRRFGRESCYSCHSDYRLFGDVATKLHGVRQVWVLATRYRRGRPEHVREIALAGPHTSARCTACHSGELPGFVAQHEGFLDEIRADTTLCTSAGCHGPAHALP